MHQRIRELVVEAGFYANPDVEKFEKFAQLIVQECAGIYSKIDNGNKHMGTDDYLEALHKNFEVENQQ